MPRLPSSKEAIQILEDEGCSITVIHHCKVVSHLAVKIAKRFRDKGIQVDMKLVEIGSLLHDIGRSKIHNIQHGIIGAKIASSLDLPKPLIKIIERHIGAGIPSEEARRIGLPPRDYLPLSLEEKIVTYADKLVKGSRYISFEEALNDFSKEVGWNHPAIKRFRKLDEEISAVVGEKNW